jgi:hypothetical protein
MKTQNNQKIQNFPLQLSKGLVEEDRQDYESAWRNSTYVTDRIKQVLLDKLESLTVDQEQDYNIPNWPYYRADKNGQIKAIKDFIRLLP